MSRIFRNLLSFVLAGFLLAGCAPLGSWYGSSEDTARRVVTDDYGASSASVAPPAAPQETPPVAFTGPEVRVGFLAPMSGRSSGLGRALLDAGMLALFDKYGALAPGAQAVQITLIPKDTEGTPQGAAKAAEKAIDEGAKFLIGPLFSEEVQAVAPIAAKRGVMVLTFSNNREIVTPGVFLFGFMPDQQVERVVKEAYRHGMPRVAALAPANAYGDSVGNALTRVARLQGNPVPALEKYPPAAKDIDIEVQHALGGRVRKEQPPIDAILLAEGGEQLQLLAARVKAFGIDTAKIKLLGTGLWDDETLPGDPNLVGGWFASSPLRSYQGFERRFERNYHYTPQRLASLAYDAVALAATMAQQGGENGFTQAAITRSNGYAGPANGIFRFRADGTCERGLAVLEVQPAGFKEISPAPRMFDTR